MIRASWLALSSISLLVVGCVPYQTYQQTKLELEKAKEANADLVKKYNLLMNKLMARGDEGPSDQKGLLARLEQLEKENAELKNRTPVTPSFSKEDMEKVGVPDEGGGMRLGEDLLFAEGSDDLKKASFNTLNTIVDILKNTYPDETVIIEGHTDNQPLVVTEKRWEFNMRLGYERAHAVMRYFIEHGIPERRMIVRSYSYNKPLDPDTASTPDGRRQNRRVVVRRGGTQI